MGSGPSRALPPPVPARSRGTQTERGCSVCRWRSCDSRAVPCGHGLCLGCLLRRGAACPLCRSPVIAARYALHGDSDCLRCILVPPGAAPGARPRMFRLVQTRPRPAPQPRAELPLAREQLLAPVRPWLRHSLSAVLGPRWWEARVAESIALCALVLHGPDSAVLARMLLAHLGDYTAPLVHGLVRLSNARCTPGTAPSAPGGHDRDRDQDQDRDQLQEQAHDEREEPPADPGPSAPAQRRDRYSRKKRIPDPLGSSQPRRRKKRRK